MTFIPNVYGVVSSNNSTVAPLGSSGIFTGSGEDVSRFAFITLSIQADQISATQGVSIQFSSDNTNWDFGETPVLGAEYTYKLRSFTQPRRF